MLLPWQESDWARLNVERERLPNAWLFTGDAGIGKLTFAEHLAHSLLCDHPKTGHQPCGKCQSCAWYQHGTHPDFRRLSPLWDEHEHRNEGSKARNIRPKLPLIKIEAVREIIDFAHFSAHRSGRRIVLVDPAGSLNLSSANALLKTLEEPPVGLLFLLIAHSSQRLQLTIRSRCRQFPMTRPAPDQALDWLRNQGISDPELELAFNGGAPLIHYDSAITALRGQFVQGLCQPNCASVLKLSEMLDTHKLPLLLPIAWLMKWLYDLASFRLAGLIRYYPGHKTLLQQLAARAHMLQLMECQQELNKLVRFDQHTLNTRLQLEAALMSYLKIFVSD